MKKNQKLVGKSATNTLVNETRKISVFKYPQDNSFLVRFERWHRTGSGSSHHMEELRLSSDALDAVFMLRNKILADEMRAETVGYLNNSTITTASAKSVIAETVAKEESKSLPGKQKKRDKK